MRKKCGVETVRMTWASEWAKAARQIGAFFLIRVETAEYASQEED